MFDDHLIQPFHYISLQFNSRWPVRQELLGAVLLRVSAIEWQGHGYAGRRMHINHTDTYVRQPDGFWLSDRTRVFVQRPIPAIQDVPLLAIQDQVALLCPSSRTNDRDASDDASRAVRRRLS